LSLLAQNIIIVVDTAFLGRVGEIELGASAIGGLFYVCLFIIGFGFASGAQILIGRRNGEGNFSQIGSYFDHSLYFLLVIGIIIIGFSKLFSDQILKSILISENIYEYSLRFLNIRIWGLIFAFINMAFRAFFIGITNTRYLTYSASIMAIVNITLDYAFIFGNWGFNKMGIEGAALASVLAEFASVLFFISVALFKVDRKKYLLFHFPRIQLQIIRKILDVAFFVMMQFLVSIVAWFGFFMIIEKTGERPLAISNIIRSLYMIFTIPIFSLGSATNTIVSNTIGERRMDAVLPAIYRISKISLFSILSVAILALMFSRQILSFYTNDIALIDATLNSFYVTLGVLVFFSIAIILLNGVAGTANTQISLFIEIIAAVIYLISAYTLAIRLKSPTHIIWGSEYIYFILLGTMSAVYLRTGKWKNKKI
jgi:putative MATE family efflux protein